MEAIVYERIDVHIWCWENLGFLYGQREGVYTVHNTGVDKGWRLLKDSGGVRREGGIGELM